MGTSKADKEKIKQLLEADTVIKAKLDAVKVTIDEFIDASNEEKKTTLDELYAEHRKKFPEVYGIETSPTPEPEPEPTPTPEPVPEPTPQGLIYDSNTNIDWGAITGEFLKVTDTYGDVKANGKGFHMNASGHPRAYLYPATKEIVVEHDGKYGRAYFAVCNYACRIEGEFKLDTPGSNASFKSRNRHQFRDMINDKASDAQTQGGQGTSFSETEVDADCEVVHGTEISGPSAKLNPKANIGEYHSFKFSQFDENGKIHIIDELDGKVVNDGFTSPPKQFFNKAEFESWSEFWVRLNANSGGRLYIKNLKVTAL